MKELSYQYQVLYIDVFPLRNPSIQLLLLVVEGKNKFQFKLICRKEAIISEIVLSSSFEGKMIHLHVSLTFVVFLCFCASSECLRLLNQARCQAFCLTQVSTTMQGTDPPLIQLKFYRVNETWHLYLFSKLIT